MCSAPADCVQHLPTPPAACRRPASSPSSTRCCLLCRALQHPSTTHMQSHTHQPHLPATLLQLQLFVIGCSEPHAHLPQQKNRTKTLWDGKASASLRHGLAIAPQLPTRPQHTSATTLRPGKACRLAAAECCLLSKNALGHHSVVTTEGPVFTACR